MECKWSLKKFFFSCLYSRFTCKFREISYSHKIKLGKVLYIASTALIVIGLLCAIGEWYEKQTMSSIYGSMIIQVVGVFEYFLAKVISKENSSFYVKWLNTIIIAFIPISMITSYISELIFKVGGGISPYPIGIFHSFVFLLVYLIVIMVSYAYLKKQNKFLI